MGGKVFSKPKPKPSPRPVAAVVAPSGDPQAVAERKRLKRLGTAGTRVGLTDALSVQRKSLLGE